MLDAGQDPGEDAARVGGRQAGGGLRQKIAQVGPCPFHHDDQGPVQLGRLRIVDDQRLVHGDQVEMRPPPGGPDLAADDLVQQGSLTGSQPLRGQELERHLVVRRWRRSPSGLAQGATNRDIARQLNIAEATVKTYLTRIFAKLDVDDRTAAVTTAIAKRLLPFDAYGL
jgi:hypothetical protein